MLSSEVRAEIDHWLSKFPPEQKQSAVLAALHAVQHEAGHVSVEAMDAVAAYLGMPKVSVYEVASFYSMIETHKVGRNNVAICTNISCWLNGAEDIVRHCEGKLGVKLIMFRFKCLGRFKCHKFLLRDCLFYAFFSW